MGRDNSVSAHSLNREIPKGRDNMKIGHWTTRSYDMYYDCPGNLLTHHFGIAGAHWFFGFQWDVYSKYTGE
jgi:hypothetical protein